LYTPSNAKVYIIYIYISLIALTFVATREKEMEIQTLDPLEIPKSLSYLICFFDNFNILKLRQLLPQDSQRRSKYNEVLGSDKDYIYNGIPSTTGVVATASSPAKGCRGDQVTYTQMEEGARDIRRGSLIYTTGIALFAVRRQRDENARHRFCRAHFPKAHGKGRPTHFYPVKNFAVRFGKRQRTAQFVAVRNR
jgi:hypothetical protein